MLTGKKARQKYFQRDTVIVVNVNKPLRRSDGARARRDDGDRGRRIRRVGVGRGGAPTARRARARALGGVPAYARRRARPRSRALGTPSRARDERYPRDPRRGRCRPFLDRAGRVSRPPHRLRAFTPRPLGRRRFRRRRRRRRPPVSHLLLRRRGWSPVRAVSLSRHDAPRPRRVPGRLAQRERAREQRVVPRVRPVRLPLPHRARRVGVVPRRSQDGRSPRVDRRRRRGDARRNPLPRRLHARARASRRQGGPRASPRTGTLRIRGNTHVPPSSARAEALAAPRPSHDWRGAVAIDAARAARTVARALSSGTRDSTSPLHVEFAFYRLVGWTDPGPPWWDAGAPRWLTSRATFADALDCLVAGAVIVGAAGCVWKLCREFRANARSVLFPVSALIASHGVGAGRLFLVGGAAFACASAHRAARRITRAALARFGERVLDVHAGVPTRNGGMPTRNGGVPRPHLD